jgi:sortase A
MSSVTLPIRTPGTPPPPRRGGVRTFVRGVGEVFITLGVLLLLMTVYQLWWTNVESAQAIAAERDVLTEEWRNAPAQPAEELVEPKPVMGEAFALLYIPRMKDKVWALPINEGTTKAVLARGAGHYVRSAMPGEVGNFALAAHRSTHGEPFANIDDLRVGDKVYVQTRQAWYTYTLQKDDPTLTPYDVWVVAPVPGQPGATPTQKLITLTTCTPRYGSTGRWAWWGEMTSVQPASAGPPDGLTGTA